MSLALKQMICKTLGEDLVKKKKEIAYQFQTQSLSEDKARVQYAKYILQTVCGNGNFLNSIAAENET